MRTLAQETVTHIGETITVSGWIQTRRDHGKIMFLDLRDRSGIVQLVATKALGDVRNEDVVQIVGIVKARPESMINPKLSTGKVEIEVQSIQTLSKAKELPIPIDTDGYDINEDMRLKYRYLDLRRPRLQHNMRLRSKFVDLIRQYLFQQDFIEIETPMLTKSTPEGSRDFIVPSRLQPGKFYALPQSPQQYKQLLMVAGFERYFQIAKCIRDEDTRADRGFEFTQIDLEMSFVEREDVMALDEAMMISVIESLGYTIKQKPFPRITYKEAMEKYGADKFDLRTEEDKKNGILAFSWVIDFPFFEKTDTGEWTFTHNPFSMPKAEHKEWLLQKEHIGDILTTQYDLVCNGYEVGGGSIRGHQPDILESVFSIMGYEKKRIYEQFGHMLEAFSYGAPPHGGLAHGVERIIMLLTQEPYLREVVAFPQTSGGRTSVMDAPSIIEPEQLLDVGLALLPKFQAIDVYGQIIEWFKKEKIVFETYEHESVRTSEEAARVRKSNIAQGAKALLFYADDKPVMIVLPGDKKVDTKAFKALFSVKELRMATPQEVETVTHVTIGAVPPLGALYEIPQYVDGALREQETIYFNAGSHTQSISMKEKDFERITKSNIGSFHKE